MSQFFAVHQHQNVGVLELKLPEVVDSTDFDHLNQSLLGLLDGSRGKTWIIDLSHVQYLGSAMLGLMVNLRQQLKNIGGTMVLCNLSPRVSDVFRTSCMERLFQIAGSKPAALRLVS
jgi:anti-anti-sigma factor